MLYISYRMNAMKDLKPLSQLLILWALLYPSLYHRMAWFLPKRSGQYYCHFCLIISVIQHFPIIIHNSNFRSICQFSCHFLDGFVSSSVVTSKGKGTSGWGRSPQSYKSRTKFEAYLGSFQVTWFGWQSKKYSIFGQNSKILYAYRFQICCPNMHRTFLPK